MQYMFIYCSVSSRLLTRVTNIQVKRTKELVAMSVQIQHSLTNGSSSNGGGGSSSNTRPIMQGFIAALKDGFGFIETSDHNKEVFFHFRYVSSITSVGRFIGILLTLRNN